MYFKSIFQGNLHFGNPKSYDKVIKMYDHRLENYYKDDVVFKHEDVFDIESLSLVIPRSVTNITEKTWKNTVDLLQYLAQFAISGNVGAWLTEEGTILRYAWIEPKGDKAVVQKFLKGKRLLEREGKEEEAEQSLSKAIELYNKHAQAYERRGYVNYLLQKYHDAERDFTKSINLDKSNAPAYYGRAKIKFKKEQWQGAIDDLSMAIKSSLALQDIHWMARRMKGECHMRIKEYKEAEFEFRFFSRRKFKSSSKNFAYKYVTKFNHGRALIELEKYGEALEVLDNLLKLEAPEEKVPEADVLLYRGIARKNTGKNGFKADWNKATKLGSKRAKQLLETI